MKVSVWIGNAPCWEVLDDYLTFTFTEDGDAIPCRFADAFGIDWFDDDYREASVSEHSTLSVKELLQRHSHGAEIADALGDASWMTVPCNAVVLLFEFEYSGSIESAVFGGANLQYLGTVQVAADRG